MVHAAQRLQAEQDWGTGLWRVMTHHRAQAPQVLSKLGLTVQACAAAQPLPGDHATDYHAIRYSGHMCVLGGLLH